MKNNVNVIPNSSNTHWNLKMFRIRNEMVPVFPLDHFTRPERSIDRERNVGPVSCDPIRAEPGENQIPSLKKFGEKAEHLAKHLEARLYRSTQSVIILLAIPCFCRSCVWGSSIVGHLLVLRITESRELRRVSWSSSDPIRVRTFSSMNPRCDFPSGSAVSTWNQDNQHG